MTFSVWLRVWVPVRAKTTLPTVAGLVLARILSRRVTSVARFSVAPSTNDWMSGFVVASAFTSVKVGAGLVAQSGWSCTSLVVARPASSVTVSRMR